MAHVLQDQDRVRVQDVVQISADANRMPVGGDKDLQLSRRLDWRFLLPQPDLGYVAYLGSDDTTLESALSHFCPSLAIIPNQAGKSAEAFGSRTFPLVVLRSWKLSDLQTASALLSPGGSLYWEIDRKAWLFPGRGVERFWQLYSHNPVARLGRLGFTAVETYWHHPDFETCREIIPLNDRATLDFALSRNHGGVGRQLLLRGARHLARTGALRHLVPCLSVVARKNEGTAETR